MRAHFSEFVDRLDKGEFVRAEELYQPLKASYGVMIPQTVVWHIADLLVGKAMPPKGKATSFRRRQNFGEHRYRNVFTNGEKRDRRRPR